MFKCPKCGCTELNEHEVGPTVTREVQCINRRHFSVEYDTYWISVDVKKWWTCRACGWRLPVVGSIPALIAYLEREQ